MSRNRVVLRRAAHAGVAVACAAGGLWLAGRHPLAPAWVTLLWMACLGAAWRWPRLWLLALPAAMPVLSLAPWTGWIAVDETDLLILAALAAGHAGLALRPGPVPVGEPEEAALRSPLRDGLLVLLGISLLAGLWLAWVDVHRPPLHEAGAYTSYLNSLRIGKALAYALLFVPMLRGALRASAVGTQRAVGAGMVVGLVGLALGVLWERGALPGLLNFASDYRTVGLFWEMNVGGAAIDAYLTLAVPFVVWAVMVARSLRAWLAAALLAQVVAYVCLTTFSRGVYGAVVGGLVVAGVLARWQRPASDLAWDPGWRRRANAWLCVLLVTEVLLMALASSFMADRLATSRNDFGDRLSHWARGVSILQTPREWFTGIGLGRLPERYADLGAAGEFPGAGVVLADGNTPGTHFLRLQGPPTRWQLAGRYALTQQVALVPGARYRLALDLRTEHSVRLRVLVCERHLLYEGDCQVRHIVHRGSTGGQWVRADVQLLGPGLDGGAGWAPRRASLELSVVGPARAVDLDNLALSAGPQLLQLRNAGFERGMAHWFPVIDHYFLPWHIDNLYLEWLIERGAPALLVFAGLAGLGLWRVSFGAARGHPLAPMVAAALSGVCALGLVSSVMDMPRVAFLFLLLLLLALHLPRAETQADAAGHV